MVLNWSAGSMSSLSSTPKRCCASMGGRANAPVLLAGRIDLADQQRRDVLFEFGLARRPGAASRAITTSAVRNLSVISRLSGSSSAFLYFVRSRTRVPNRVERAVLPCRETRSGAPCCRQSCPYVARLPFLVFAERLRDDAACSFLLPKRIDCLVRILEVESRRIERKLVLARVQAWTLHLPRPAQQAISSEEEHKNAQRGRTTARRLCRMMPSLPALIIDV